MKDTRAIVTRGGSAQIDFRLKPGYLSQIAAGAGLSVVRGGLICQGIEDCLFLTSLPGRLMCPWMMTEAASAAFVARASDTPPRGVLGV